jgi:predicted Fe-S protein YdhL (DUF1289 family)
VANAEELAADAGDVERAIPCRLVDALATVLTGRYASVVHRWDGEVTEAFMQKLRALRMMCQDVTRLRKGEHSAAKLKIQEGWLEEAREKTEAEVVAKFEEWAKNKDVHDWLVQTWVSPKERERRKREMLGLPPLEEESKVQSQKSKVEDGGKFNDQNPNSKENSNSKVQAPNPVGVGPAESRVEQTGQMDPQEEADWAALEDESKVQSPKSKVEDASPAGSSLFGKSNDQNPKSKENSNFKVQAPDPVGVSPAESGVERLEGGTSKIRASKSKEEVWDRLPANIPRPCDGPCTPGPEGYCLKCFWKPGEIEQPAENLRGEFIGLFGGMIEARRRVHELAPTTGASPETPANGARPPAPPAQKIASPCVGICQRDQGGHCCGCGRSIPEILRWPTMSEAEKAQVTRHLAQRRAKSGGGAV